MAQDATRAGAKEHKQHSDHHKSAEAGAPASTRARAYKKKLQKQ